MRVRVVVETSVGVNYPADPRKWTWADLVRLVERRTREGGLSTDGTRFSVEVSA